MPVTSSENKINSAEDRRITGRIEPRVSCEIPGDCKARHDALQVVHGEPR